MKQFGNVTYEMSVSVSDSSFELAAKWVKVKGSKTTAPKHCTYTPSFVKQ